MNPLFKYNGNTKYSTRDLKGGYIGNNFLVLDVHLKKKDHLLKSSGQIYLRITRLWQNQVLQLLAMLSSRYLMLCG